MNAERNAEEGMRWLDQADGELVAARVMAEAGYWWQVCRQSHLTAELSLKAVGHYRGDKRCWTHHLDLLLKNVTNTFPELNALSADVRLLGNYHSAAAIYPYSFGVFPSDKYSEGDANGALEVAERVFAAAREIIPSWAGSGRGSENGGAPYLAGARRVGWDDKTGKTAAPVKDLAHVSRPHIPTLEDIREMLTPALEETGALRAIVFGSHARSEAKEFSDLDLVIVAETERRFVTRFEDFHPVQDAWNWAMDLIVYTPAEYEMMRADNRYVIEMLETEGVVIYEHEGNGAEGSPLDSPGLRTTSAAPVKDLAHVSRPHIPTLEDIREMLTPALEETGALRAIVFGSHARSEAKEFSDLDLVIVADSEQNFPSRPMDFRAVNKAWNWAMDMIVYTPAEYEMMLAKGRGFVEMLETEGVVIYERERNGAEGSPPDSPG